MTMHAGLWQTIRKAAGEPDWWVAAFTFCLFVVTAVLAIFTYKLWRTTKTAVADTAAAITHAETTANASLRQAEAAERSFVVLERPYIFPEIEGQEIKTDSAVSVNRAAVVVLPKVMFRFKNFGKNLGIVTRLGAFVDVVDERPDGPDYGRVNMGRGEIFLAASDHTVTYTYYCEDWLKVPTYNDVMKKKAFVVLYGYVEYTGVFGGEYRTNFGFFYVPDFDGMAVLGPAFNNRT